MMLVNMKLHYGAYQRIREHTRELHFKVPHSIGLLHFSRHSQNEVGNVDILVLSGDFKKKTLVL